jgi:hypothetical protein
MNSQDGSGLGGGGVGGMMLGGGGSALGGGGYGGGGAKRKGQSNDPECRLDYVVSSFTCPYLDQPLKEIMYSHL